MSSRAPLSALLQQPEVRRRWCLLQHVQPAEYLLLSTHIFAFRKLLTVHMLLQACYHQEILCHVCTIVSLISNT